MKCKDIKVLIERGTHRGLGNNFAIGKAQVLSDVTDVSIFACGHIGLDTPLIVDAAEIAIKRKQYFFNCK